MMDFHHIMDFHNFIWFVKSLAVLITYWYKMSLVKPLFVASITSLTLMMINTSSNINLPQQMGILPTLGTCSNWCLQVGGAAPTARRSSHCCRTESSATATPPCMMLSFSCMSFATVITHTKETFLPQEGCKETHLSRNILFPTALHDDWWIIVQLRILRPGYNKTNVINN